MSWKLIKVKQTDWVQDNSGYYTLINYISIDCATCKEPCIDCVGGHVRLDVMGIADSLNPTDYPVISFQGKAEDVRKHIMQNWNWIAGHVISYEHASYIGSELARCELLKTEYIQD